MDLCPSERQAQSKVFRPAPIPIRSLQRREVQLMHRRSTGTERTCRPAVSCTCISGWDRAADRGVSFQDALPQRESLRPLSLLVPRFGTVPQPAIRASQGGKAAGPEPNAVAGSAELQRQLGKLYRIRLGAHGLFGDLKLEVETAQEKVIARDVAHQRQEYGLLCVLCANKLVARRSRPKRSTWKTTSPASGRRGALHAQNKIVVELKP